MSNPGPAITTATAYGFGPGVGALIGQTTAGPIAFFGSAMTAQPASSSQAASASTAAVSISATQWGFATSAQADAVITLVNRMRADLVSLGLIKGSA